MSSNLPPRFLVDVNLPFYFSLWNNPEHIHQRDIDDRWTDDQIWKYATENDLTIITKDADFSAKVMFHKPPPKVIHVRVGNMKIGELFLYLTGIWPEVVKLNSNHKLINIFRDRIEAVE